MHERKAPVYLVMLTIAVPLCILDSMALGMPDLLLFLIAIIVICIVCVIAHFFIENDASGLFAGQKLNEDADH
ncbi:hypothetical protein [Spirosoma pollinicola]|uniref:Uncharacterized protein n=1 Tax=Spirosoma pollinicola TaxID=2057025 RepID=A0A2K8YYB1_9BACT|nr:hypothetical protein [Spirosoma pollinicola]AUD02538.1 hypothetical protein CWM47_12270 [Spirosoma pollinicola]